MIAIGQWSAHRAMAITASSPVLFYSESKEQRRRRVQPFGFGVFFFWTRRVQPCTGFQRRKIVNARLSPHPIIISPICPSPPRPPRLGLSVPRTAHHSLDPPPFL